MLNQAFLEMLALEKFKENLRLAQQDRMIANISRDSSKATWKKLLSWAFARQPGDRKPARA